MERYLVDTTVLVDHLRSRGRATEFLKKENLVISEVAMAELIAGARDRKELNLVMRLAKSFEVDWGSAKINKLAIELLKKYHLPTGLHYVDSLVAATALANGWELVTDNVKHFRMIEGLRVVTLANMLLDRD